MSLVWPVLAGLVLAVVLGGKLQRLADLRLRGVWLFYAGFAVKVVAFPFSWLPWHTPEGAAKILWYVSYGVLIAAVAANFRMPGVVVVCVGLVTNLAATATNGGHMPALPSALRGAGLHFTVSRNSALAHNPHLSWLVDRWAAPSWIPWANVFSIGDVLISVGAVVFALVATGVLDRFRPSHRTRAVAPAA